MSWNKLHRELQLMIFEELSSLDFDCRKLAYKTKRPPSAFHERVWHEMVCYLLVCKSWNADLRVTIVESLSIFTIMSSAPQDICLEVIARLIQRAPEFPLGFRWWSIDSAVYRNFPRCIEAILRQTGAHPPPCHLLHSAVKRERTTGFRLLIARGAEMEEKGHSHNSGIGLDSNTPLGLAILRNDTIMIEELLEAGASLHNLIRSEGVALDPLQHVSANCGDGALIRLIIRHVYTMNDASYELYGGRDDWAVSEDEADLPEDRAAFIRYPTWHPLELAVRADAVSAAEALLSYDNFGHLDIARAHKGAKSKGMRQLLWSYMQRAIARG